MSLSKSSLNRPSSPPPSVSLLEFLLLAVSAGAGLVWLAGRFFG